MVKLTMAHPYYKILLSYKKEEVLFVCVLGAACGILTQQYRYCYTISILCTNTSDCTLKMVKMANFMSILTQCEFTMTLK